MSLRRNSVSIVIPTHNRYKKLRSLLESINIFSAGLVDEVIVVDDSQPLSVLPVLGGDVILNHIQLKERVYISRAKNLGWKNARSEYVYFIDDDNLVCESTIKPLVDIMESREDIGALMPAVLYKKRPDIVWVYSIPFKPSRWGFCLIGRNQRRDAALEGRLLNTDALPNACLVRSKVLEEIGGFNESLAVNSSAEFCLRIKEKRLEGLLLHK
ncbi:MAG: glycosyltransferase [Conexivisphaerales archaeon]